MKTRTFIKFSIFLFLSYSCEKEETQVSPFEGNYQTISTHITGIHMRFLSESEVEYYEDTTMVEELNLNISRQGVSDTLLIEGVLNAWDHDFRQTVQAIVEQDSLKIVHEKTTQPGIRNDYMRGKLWLVGDSLFLDYYWDKSDVYNASFGAPPTFGKVKGQGVKF